MLLCERYCLPIPMMQNIMLWRIPFHKMWRPDDHMSILRKTTSNLCKSPIRIVRWPDAKRATGVMTRSKKRSRTAKRTFLSQRIIIIIIIIITFFPRPFFSRMRVQWYRAVLVGSLQGTNCFYTSHPPDESPRPDIPLPGWEASGGHRGRCPTRNGLGIEDL